MNMATVGFERRKKCGFRLERQGEPLLSDVRRKSPFRASGTRDCQKK